MDYRNDGFVSLWIGKLKSKNLLEKLMEEDYVEEEERFSSDFAKLFKLGRYDDDFRETKYTEISNFSEAFSSFSYSDRFISYFQPIVENEMKDDYNAIILLYNFRYDGDKKEISDEEYGFLKYIGFARYDYSKEALLSELAKTFANCLN